MTRQRKAEEYIEKQRDMNLILLNNLKQSCEKIDVRTYSRIKRRLSETINILDYILMKL